MAHERSASPGGLPIEGDFHSRSTCRTFQGPLATEVYLLACSVCGRGDGPQDEAISIHRQLDQALKEMGTLSARVVRETIYFRSIREGLPAFLEARRQFAGRTQFSIGEPAATFIEQPPVDPQLSIIACFTALIPHRPRSLLIWSPRLLAPCSCEPVSRTSSAIAYSLGPAKYLLGGNISGAHGRPFDEATSMLRTAGEVLRQEGMTFKDVYRTWIYLRNMDRDYGELNRARRAFYQAERVVVRPASTGIQGRSFLEDHNFSLSFCAIDSSPPVPKEPVTTPTLNEAWSYGSDFSRGLRILEPNRQAIYISGTASVDDKGQTAHRGDFAGQAERMLLNFSTLLAGQGATFQDIVSATTYLRRPEDARSLQEIYRKNRLPEFPNALVTAGACRPELLCEMEAVALLPHAPLEAASRNGRSPLS